MPTRHTSVSPTHAHLVKVGPLWENGFHNWTQIFGQALDGRPNFLEDREIIWANPSVRFPLPQKRVHARKYARATLASTSMAHWYILMSNVNKPFGLDDPIAHRWRSILEMDWGTIPDKPSPLVLDAASKQLSNQRALMRATRFHPQGGLARQTKITLHIPPIKLGHKKKYPHHCGTTQGQRRPR